MGYPRLLTLLLLSSTLVACGTDEAETADAATSGTSGAGGGGTGGGGTGGSGAGIPMGDPIDAPENEWTWVDFPESRCMNDTPTGIGINKTTASKDVVIFLMGGNACFNQISCAVTANTKGYAAAQFDGEKGDLASTPLFRREGTNPFKDMSFVYVPYCTGDVHGGAKSGEMVGGAVRNFRGFANMTDYLARVVPTFADATHVVLAGVSAGGFGAAYNYDQVVRAFGRPDLRVTLVDDSGPPMGEQYVPACLQKFFMDTWGLDKTLPAACADCGGATGVFMEPMVNHIASTYPNQNLTIVSSTQDATIRQFWGYGENDCSSLGGLPPAYAGAKYEAGLVDLRDRIGEVSANFFAYYVDGSDGMDNTEHVFLDDDPSTVSSNGVLFQTWLTQVVADDPALTSVPQQ
jgi:hypothetical protein